MPFSMIFQPSQVKILRKALDEHCQARGITRNDDREEVAARLIQLYDSGVTAVEDLLDSLRRS